MVKLKQIVIFLLVLFFCFPTYAFDPYEGQQWYLEKIKAPEAWLTTTGDPEVIVAIIDTGIDFDHPDLQENIWINNLEISGDGVDNDNNGYVDDYYGWNFIRNNNEVEPSLTGDYDVSAVNHGTFLAGLIGAIHNNDFGIKGVVGQVKIMPLIALDENGFGDSRAVAKAIDYAVNKGADVINLSFGGFQTDYTLKDAIWKAYKQNVVIVAGAGNNAVGGIDLEQKKVYPICYDLEWAQNVVIGVGSSDEDNELSFFSNFGPCLDILAPGRNLIGTVFQSEKFPDLQLYIDSGYEGTSFSTALVSGAVAMLKSVNRSLSVNQIIEMIQQSATDISGVNLNYESQIGAGLLNIKGALDLLLQDNGSYRGLSYFFSADRELHANILQYDSNFKLRADVEALGGEFSGLNIAGADLDGDNLNDLVVGARHGAMPFVRGLSPEGLMYSSFLGFESEFRGGVRAVAGDVNGDGIVEYVVVPQSGRQPVVRIFSFNGQLIKEFSAFDSKYNQGLTVAVGNVTGDEKDEIIVGAPTGALPEVKVFDYAGNLLKTIMVYAENFRGGVNVLAENMDDDKYAEILVGVGQGGGPQVRVFKYSGQVLASFFAYNSNFRGGVRLSAGDFDGDGQREIITVPGPTGGPHVRIWDINGQMKAEFFALWASFTAGIQVVVR